MARRGQLILEEREMSGKNILGRGGGAGQGHEVGMSSAHASEGPNAAVAGAGGAGTAAHDKVGEMLESQVPPVPPLMLLSLVSPPVKWSYYSLTAFVS